MAKDLPEIHPIEDRNVERRPSGNVVTVHFPGYATWELGKRRISCKDRVIVTQVFELFPGIPFRLQLVPTIGNSVKRTKNSETLELFLKYEGAYRPHNLAMVFALGHGDRNGVVVHNFNRSPLCQLQGSFDPGNDSILLIPVWAQLDKKKDRARTSRA